MFQKPKGEHWSTHPVAPVVPTGPFEAVASDYFNLAGNHYLVVVDRLTNWADVRLSLIHI